MILHCKDMFFLEKKRHFQSLFWNYHHFSYSGMMKSLTSLMRQTSQTQSSIFNLLQVLYLFDDFLVLTLSLVMNAQSDGETNDHTYGCSDDKSR